MEEFRSLIQRARGSDLCSFSEMELDQYIQLCKTIEEVKQRFECDVDLCIQNSLPTQRNRKDSSSGRMRVGFAVSVERFGSWDCPT